MYTEGLNSPFGEKGMALTSSPNLGMNIKPPQKIANPVQLGLLTVERGSGGDIDCPNFEIDSFPR